jgi:hypothetical protein
MKGFSKGEDQAVSEAYFFNKFKEVCDISVVRRRGINK